MTDTVQTPSPLRTGRWKQWLLTPWSFVIGIPLLVLLLDPTNVAPIVEIAVTAFAGTLPYIIVAILLIAWLKSAGAESVIAEAFKGRENRMIVLAALFGGLAPFCSCEVIPFIAGLLALGAPLSAVMAFWLASPLLDPPTFFITAGALGWPFAVGKAVTAVSLGLFGGFAMKAMLKAGFFADPLKTYASSGCGCGPSPFNGKPVWAVWSTPERRATFGAEFLSNGLFLAKWLAFAYILQGLMVTYIPATLIASVVGGTGVLPVITAALVGMPAYLNGYVAPPLLSGLIDQGMSQGAAMAFLTAGAVSSIPAMTAVFSLVKSGVFASYLVLALAGAVMAGLIFQMVV